MWCLPPHANAAFVAQMEEILAVYQRPYDPCRPQICLDELHKQLLGEVTPPLPMVVGQPMRSDYEYVRNGTANLFMLCEPLRGWRQVTVTAQRTKIDWAHCVRELVDRYYPAAQCIVLVLDNLNTHTTAALYEAFAPAEARRIAERLEIHYTPKHGSWLNPAQRAPAEIELSVLSRQCLDRRMEDQPTLREAVGAWNVARNVTGKGIDWRFTTEDARIKLKHLYPSIES